MLPVNELFTQEARDCLFQFYNSYEPVVELLKFRALPPVKVKTVFFGDSITAGFKFQEFFPGCSLLNRGIPGDSLDGLWARIDMDVLPYDPEQVVILAGINGIAEDNGRMMRKFEAIGDQLTAKGIRVYYCSIAPLRHGDQWDRFQYQGKIAELNEMIRKMAEDKYAGFVDYFHALLDDQGELKEEYARADGTHITFEGYCAMAQVLKKSVDLYGKRDASRVPNV